MKTIYLDSEYMCHLEDGEGRTAVETDVFDGAVDRAIPCYRYIPAGKSYRDDKGRVIHGLFVQATDSEMIDRITQSAIMADMQNALSILGVQA